MVKGIGNYFLSAILGVGGAAGAGSYGAVNYFNNRNSQEQVGNKDLVLMNSDSEKDRKGSQIDVQNVDEKSSDSERLGEITEDNSRGSLISSESQSIELGSRDDSTQIQQNEDSQPFAEYVFNGEDSSSPSCEKLIYSSDGSLKKEKKNYEECLELLKKVKEMAGGDDSNMPQKWLRTNKSGFSDAVKEFLFLEQDNSNSFTYESFSGSKRINNYLCYSSEGDLNDELIISCYSSSEDEEQQRDDRSYETVDFRVDDERFRVNR